MKNCKIYLVTSRTGTLLDGATVFATEEGAIAAVKETIANAIIENDRHNRLNKAGINCDNYDAVIGFALGNDMCEEYGSKSYYNMAATESSEWTECLIEESIIDADLLVPIPESEV